MFEPFQPFDPYTSHPQNPRCWACRDTGWVIEYDPTCYGTAYSQCACRVFVATKTVQSSHSIPA